MFQPLGGSLSSFHPSLLPGRPGHPHERIGTTTGNWKPKAPIRKMALLRQEPAMDLFRLLPGKFDAGVIR